MKHTFSIMIRCLSVVLTSLFLGIFALLFYLGGFFAGLAAQGPDQELHYYQGVVDGKEACENSYGFPPPAHGLEGMKPCDSLTNNPLCITTEAERRQWCDSRPRDQLFLHYYRYCIAPFDLT